MLVSGQLIVQDCLVKTLGAAMLAITINVTFSRIQLPAGSVHCQQLRSITKYVVRFLHPHAMPIVALLLF
jgi:hypothetical protein